MAATFPTSPTNGQTAQVGGRFYTYNSTIGAWQNTAAVSTTASIANLTVTSNATVAANLTVDNLSVTGTNTSTGNITLANLRSTGGILTTISTTNLVLHTNTGTSSGNIVIEQGANANINITTNGTGVTNITRAYLAAGTATAGTAPLEIAAGTNLTAPEAGAVEYDGTTFFATPNTNFGRGSIPTTIYTSGAGTILTLLSEATNQLLFPAANDTITLPIGTYSMRLIFATTRPAGSSTSAQLRVRLGGAGTAVGTFRGTAIGSSAVSPSGGTPSQFLLNGVTLTADNNVSAASTTAGHTYVSLVTGILRITTAGTFIPQYSLSANLVGASGANASSAANQMILQSLTTSDSAAATGGWA